MTSMIFVLKIIKVTILQTRFKIRFRNFVLKYFSLLASATTRFPHSSLFWPRKGQTLDNYIRECDLKTRTDVEKVKQ